MVRRAKAIVGVACLARDITRRERGPAAMNDSQPFGTQSVPGNQIRATSRGFERDSLLLDEQP